MREDVLWVIEAKSKQSLFDQALNEAEAYATKLNQSDRFQLRFISGVAGSNAESFLIRTLFFDGDKYSPVKLNGVEATGLLSPDQVRTILETYDPDIKNAQVDLKLFLASGSSKKF